MKLIASSPISEGADSEAWQEQGSSAGDSPQVEQEQPAEGWPGARLSLLKSLEISNT